MVRGFQCQFCARFQTWLPSQKARYWVTPTTSWVSNPRDRNNVIIERAIRRYLRKATGELTKADLEKVRGLSLHANQLTDVKGLENLTQLTFLSLSDNQLTDVKNLEKLNQLTVLWLGGNQLTDVKGLEKLTQLTRLGLTLNKLTDVKGLENLTKLKHLFLMYNPNLTKAQLDELKKALPKCVILSKTVW